MCNYYSTINSVVLTFSNILEENGIDVVNVRFERPNDKGFDFAQGKIPHFIFNQTCGFTEDELLQFEKYLRNNSSLIWELAKEKGGEQIA
ncbi:MAG: hypothetical protein RSF40_11725 [Oscillospiraceae bacterium]